MSNDPELLHMAEAQAAACLSFDNIAKLSDYLKWSGLYSLSKEADEVCSWLDTVQDQLETMISKEGD